MDYQTLRKLKPRTGKIITGLGTGAHLERWGFSPDQLIEKDWNESADLGDGFIVNTTPARHFSGRGFKRQQALWLSFVLQTPRHKIFLGGDSGYDTHFKKIGEEHGPFDLAILECGQYNKSWKHIHMMPEELIQAAHDLRAEKLLPVHWGKFTLSTHDWDEPIKRVSAAAKAAALPLLTPRIGEPVYLDEANGFSEWWLQLEQLGS